MKHRSIFRLALASALLAACGDPPAPSPDRPVSTASSAVSVTAAPSAPSASASAEEPAPSASATADPAPSASAEASAAPPPSASASSTAPAAAKGFALPSPKSGILTAAQADKLAPAGGKVKVKLLDAGKDPQSELSYRPTKGDVVPMVVDLSQKVNVVAEGQQGAVVSPPQVLDVDVQTGDVDDTGALVSMLLRGITLKPVDGIDPGALDQIAKVLQGLKGYALRQHVSPHGDSSDVKVEAPPSAPQGTENLLASLGAVLRMMIPRLPDDPVGTGAKWQALSRMDQSGTSVVQLVEYTLKERSGSRITLSFQTRQLAAGDAVKLPAGVPAGVTTKLAKFSTTASGSVVMDTTQMAPVKGKATMDQKFIVDVTAPGQGKGGTDKVQTNADMKMTVSFTRKSGSAPAASAPAASAPAPAPSSGAP